MDILGMEGVRESGLLGSGSQRPWVEMAPQSHLWGRGRQVWKGKRKKMKKEGRKEGRRN
jgi:hypothetical protein